MKREAHCVVNPTLACGNLLNFEKELDILKKTGIKMVHIDIMDGHYVPNLCFNVDTVAAIRKKYPFVLDVHLMVSNPEDYISQLKNAGADYIAFHQDAVRFSVRLLNLIHEYGMKGGVVLNPSQNVESLKPILRYLDYVIIMGVEPGFSGQCFLENTIEKVQALHNIRTEFNYTFAIEVDGGVSFHNTAALIKSGADILVSGAFGVFRGEGGLEEDCIEYQKFVEGI